MVVERRRVRIKDGLMRRTKEGMKFIKRLLSLEEEHDSYITSNPVCDTMEQ
jgi:hypothetical protein